MTMIVPMLKEVVKAHFGGVEGVAKALNISPVSVYGWPDLVPPAAAMELEKLTRGALKVNPDTYIQDAKRKRKRSRVNRLKQLGRV